MMKRTIFTAVILTLSVHLLKAQGDKYTQTMEKYVAALDTSHSLPSLQDLGNSFSRVANAEGDKWLPYYYAAYCHTMQAFMNEGNKDQMQQQADKAEELISKADELNPGNAEVLCIKSLIMSARISINPVVNGPILGPQSGELLDKAAQIAPENPRPAYLKGQALFYTPEMFGGGKEKAKPFLEKGLEKFETFKPESSIHPRWGRQQAEMLLEQCK